MTCALKHYLYLKPDDVCVFRELALFFMEPYLA